MSPLHPTIFNYALSAHSARLDQLFGRSGATGGVWLNGSASNGGLKHCRKADNSREICIHVANMTTIESIVYVEGACGSADQ